MQCNAAPALLFDCVCTGLVLNGALVAQILLYAKNTKAAAAKTAKKKAQ